MELECVISNQMKDYTTSIYSAKFQDHITNSEMARACVLDTSPRNSKYVWSGLFHIVQGAKARGFIQKIGHFN